MKFVPAFLFLGVFSTLAYMVWTGEYPYHLIPLDDADPGRVDRMSGYVDNAVSLLGSYYTGFVLLGTGLLLSFLFVTEFKKAPEY